jgi:hypothetical protein
VYCCSSLSIYIHITQPNTWEPKEITRNVTTSPTPPFLSSLVYFLDNEQGDGGNEDSESDEEYYEIIEIYFIGLFYYYYIFIFNIFSWVPRYPPEFIFHVSCHSH